MPIDFVCSCGKHMKAKEAFAGRKIKCPQCDTLVRIPRLGPLPTSAANARSAPTAVHPVVHRPSSGNQSMGDLGVATAPPPISARKVVALLAPEVIDMPDEASVHAWIDRSLAQQSTPWLPGDEEQFQRGIKAPREGWTGFEILVLGLVVVVGSALMAWMALGHS
jgi:hypothetical protein